MRISTQDNGIFCLGYSCKFFWISSNNCEFHRFIQPYRSSKEGKKCVTNLSVLHAHYIERYYSSTTLSCIWCRQGAFTLASRTHLISEDVVGQLVAVTADQQVTNRWANFSRTSNFSLTYARGLHIFVFLCYQPRQQLAAQNMIILSW